MITIRSKCGTLSLEKCIKRGNFIATHHILTAAFVFNSAIENNQLYHFL